jgi:hypothetical protein
MATVQEMWSRAGRNGVLNRALAALLAIVVCGGALNWGHAGGDDPDCDPTPVVHDHNAHRFGAAPSHSTQPAEHCYICHSLRLLSNSLTAGGPRVVVAVRSSQFVAVEALAVINAFGVAVSSRAPPAVSL